jgi:hypothetical protein
MASRSAAGRESRSIVHAHQGDGVEVADNAVFTDRRVSGGSYTATIPRLRMLRRGAYAIPRRHLPQRRNEGVVVRDEEMRCGGGCRTSRLALWCLRERHQQRSSSHQKSSQGYNCGAAPGGTELRCAPPCGRSVSYLEELSPTRSGRIPYAIRESSGANETSLRRNLVDRSIPLLASVGRPIALAQGNSVCAHCCTANFAPQQPAAPAQEHACSGVLSPAAGWNQRRPLRQRPLRRGRGLRPMFAPG